MQDKKATVREWEVVERVEIKTDGMYQVQDNLHHRKEDISTVSTSRRVSG